MAKKGQKSVKKNIFGNYAKKIIKFTREKKFPEKIKKPNDIFKYKLLVLYNV